MFHLRATFDKKGVLLSNNIHTFRIYIYIYILYRNLD